MNNYNLYKTFKKMTKKQSKLNKNTNKIIENQENFVKREQIVLNLLKFYFNDESYNPITKNNDKCFKDIFSNEILKELQYDPTYIEEFLLEFAESVENGYKNKYITIESNGIFSYFTFTKNKKKRITLDKVIEFSDFSNFQGW